MEATEKKPSIELIAGVVLLPLIFSWFTLRSGYSTRMRVLSIGWMVLYAIFAFNGEDSDKSNYTQTKSSSLSNTTSTKTTKNDQSTAYDQRDLKVVDAIWLAEQYGTNEARADRDHKGNTYIIQGLVESVDQDLFDDTVIRLRGSNMFLNVTANLTQTKRNLEKAYELNKGDEVEIICTVVGEVMSLPRLEKCNFR